MKTPDRITVLDLLPQIDQLLIELLESLTLDDWSKQSLAPKWTVKDIATHLLDGNLRTLSILRDGFMGDPPGAINEHVDMVSYLNRLNADWVMATKRLSPKVLIQWLQHSGQEYCDYLKSLDPDAQAQFSVGWAGESESKNWFHIAREYTEKWHHQQQIRVAVGKEPDLLLKGKWYLPYLDTSVRALPYHYRNIKGETRELIQFVFRGEQDKNWWLQYQNGRWHLLVAIDQKSNCEVIIPDEYAWRIFTKGITRNLAIAQSQITGRRELGLPIFDMLAIMA